MRLPTVVLLFLFGFVCAARSADDLSKYETWITGEVFTEKDQLLFRADKAVKGNTTGKVVLLGASKETVKVILPVYAKAAETHQKLRLYGVLLPTEAKPAKGQPSVVFITWKVHLPTDPDELPKDQKIVVREGDTVEGVPVRSVPRRK